MPISSLRVVHGCATLNEQPSYLKTMAERKDELIEERGNTNLARNYRQTDNLISSRLSITLSQRGNWKSRWKQNKVSFHFAPQKKFFGKFDLFKAFDYTAYCASKKSWPILCSKLLNKLGQTSWTNSTTYFITTKYEDWIQIKWVALCVENDLNWNFYYKSVNIYHNFMICTENLYS